MKKVERWITLFAVGLLLMITGCAPGGKTARRGNKNSFANKGADYWILEDYLRRIGKVRVQGSGDNITLSIRGPNSINSPNKQPLFVVNGQKLGRDYSSVNDLFAPGEIKSVRVLSAAEASMYGMQGNYGVILIDTKPNYSRNNIK